MVGDLGVRPNTGNGVTVWRVPTRWDRLAYAIPSVFCLGAAAGGVGLSVLLGARFLFLVFPALFLSVVFVLLGVHGVSTVTIDSRGVVISRIMQSSIAIPASNVNNITAERGNRPHELGVVIRHNNGKRVVLYGLREKDRESAALTLCEALNCIAPASIAYSDSNTDTV